jgi:L-ribulose-5-phosphate 4-epimerase
MVVVDFDLHVAEGRLNPSSDTPTHIELYRRFTDIGGVAHTHSRCAASFAQALKPIPAYGTTHADYFYGEIPCTRLLTSAEVAHDYEKNTGLVILEAFRTREPTAVPGAIVANHGPFSWGTSPADAVHNAVVLEEVAAMAIHTQALQPGVKPIGQYILDKHYFRKHGEGSYYGQR